MKAVVYHGPGSVQVDQVEDAGITAPTDAVLRVTSTAICGSDLHMYEGRTGLEEGTVLGHEIMGVIEEVGKGVRSIRAGDRVVLPFNIACGACFNCNRGYWNACLTMNEQAPHAGFGYAGMGPYRGGQAEWVTVPMADVNCLKLPGEPGDVFEDDFMMLADVFPTGYHAVEQTSQQPGETIAIWGAGPVGLMSALSAKMRGASEIYVVDAVPERLEKVESLGAIPIDFSKGSPPEQIRQYRSEQSPWTETQRRGEERMDGVMCAIDAIGYQALDEDDTSREQPTAALEDIAQIINPTGRLSIIGVFMAPDPGADDEAQRQGAHQLPLAALWDKGVSIGMGQAPVKRYNTHLRDEIIAGNAQPSFLVTQRPPLDEAPDAYRRFDRREPGYTKVVMKPQAA